MKKIFIINAHQFYENSPGKLNEAMIKIMRGELEAMDCKIKLTNIEKGYDAKEEVEKHLWADIIITQSPVFWFGTPWIHKKYIDEVFNAGIVAQSMLTDDGRTRKDVNKQYGTGGKMQGKKHMLSLTWNAPKEAFGNKDQNMFDGKIVDEIFISYTSPYKFCGVKILPSFSCYDVKKNPDIEAYAEKMKIHLKNVVK